MTGRIGAIVLAGGRSARFGHDKLAEPLDGRPLLHHAIDAVTRVADEVVVVTAPGGRLDVPAGVRVVHDDQAFDGPLAGLAVGLAALPDDVDRAIVAAGDMPSLVPAVLARLLATVGPTGDAAGVLGVGDDAPPLPLAIDRQRGTAATARLLAAGERRLRDLVATLDARVIAEAAWRTDDPAAATLRDIDVPGDLADMRRPPPVDGGRARRDEAEGRRPRLR